MILIAGAGLLARSFVRLLTVDNGYTAGGVLVASVELPRGETDARTDEFIEKTLLRLRALPGVSAAGAGAMIPLMKQTAIMPFDLPESATGGKPARGRALVYWVTPGYAEALGLRLHEGRFFVDRDARAGNLMTIVNDEFVRQHLASAQVTGLLIPNLVGQEKGTTAEIVGVVGNVLKGGNDQQAQPALYFVHGSHGQRISDEVKLVVRATGNPSGLARDVRSILRQVEPAAVVDSVEPLTTTLAASLDTPRFAAAVMAGFAGVAVVLAAVGLHGALSYSVSQRVRELAVRSALGAQRADLVRLVLREGLSVTLAGIVLGVLGAALFARAMQSLLFGVTPLDATSFASRSADPRCRLGGCVPRSGAARGIHGSRQHAARPLIRARRPALPRRPTGFEGLVRRALQRRSTQRVQEQLRSRRGHLESEGDAERRPQRELL